MSPEVHVSGLALRFGHELGFTIDRPQGIGEHLFLHFRVPVEVSLGGQVRRAAAGTCLLFAPGCPQWYRGRGVGLVNDWMHLGGPGLPALIGRYQIPCNELLNPRATGFINDVFEAIAQEQRWQGPHWREAVRLRLEELLLSLARALRPEEPAALTAAEAAQLADFRAIRGLVAERLAEPWTVAAMARRAHLSSSRFAVLYKRFFGVSPMEDLLQARLTRAKLLLLNQTALVAAAAAESGFTNPCYFSRLFRRRVGCAPSEYYRRTLGGPEPQ
jgi:AraC family transcriptional regulator of arabinose operon